MPLPIEMDPRATWGFNRAELFGRDRWRALCDEAAGKADGHCEACRSPLENSMDCDPMWSWRLVEMTSGTVFLLRRLIRIRALDRECFLATHYGWAGVLGVQDAARERLARVNGLSQHEVETMITNAFELWRWRSSFRCLTDLRSGAVRDPGSVRRLEVDQ